MIKGAWPLCPCEGVPLIEELSSTTMRLLLVVLLSCTAQVHALVVHNRACPWMKAGSRGMLQEATSTIIPQRSRLNSVIERGSNDSGSSASSADTSRRITWSAAVKSSVWVREDAERRTVKEYMALPATQYSVLSALVKIVLKRCLRVSFI